MNLKARSLFAIVFLGLLYFMLPGPLRADTTYTYTGNPYAFCSGTYTNGVSNVCSQPSALSLTFTTSLSGAQLDNLTLNASQDIASAHCGGCTGIGPIDGNLTAYVSAFSFTDGTGFSVTQADTMDYGFDVTTDGNGNIQSWFIYAQSYPSSGSGGFYQALTESGLGLGPLLDNSLLESYDGSVAGTEVSGNFYESGGGEVDSTESPFAVSGAEPWTATTPEPSNLLLLGFGSLALFGMKWPTSRLGIVGKRDLCKECGSRPSNHR
jgi:hypothetical protein